MPRWSPFDPAADRRLVWRLTEGDEESLATLYSLYAERLYDYCLAMTSDAKMAADIVHDTFIDARRRAPRMRDRDQLRPWLYAAARRRCLQRVRVRALGWEWRPTGTITPHAGGPEAAGAGVGAAGAGVEGPSYEETRALFERAMGRLDFVDQETLTLALRHGLRDSDLAATIGVGTRRTAGRVSRARARFLAAFDAELWSAARDCAAGSGPPPPARAPQPDEAAAEPVGHAAALDAGPSDADAIDPVERHMESCERCRRRAGLTAGGLFGLPSVPVLPAALRHRVMHTGGDPELAGHRADIAARGGNLTPHGLPRQPDVPSPFTRRWLFAAGGVASTLVTALVAGVIIGPPLPEPWPFHPKQQPSTRAMPSEPPPQPGAPAPGAPAPQPGAPTAPADPGVGGSAPTMRPGEPNPGATSPTPTLPVGVLTIGSLDVALAGNEKAADIQLTADTGPVTWKGTPSTEQLSITPQEGTIAPGQTVSVRVVLADSLITLPGEGKVTFSYLQGLPQDVKVRWGLSAA